MPTYDFRNKETGEVTEHIMRISQLDQFKADHPELEKVIISGIGFVADGDKGKTDQRFEQEVIARIRDTVPGNNIARNHKHHINSGR